jgi:hypothetical protein
MGWIALLRSREVQELPMKNAKGQEIRYLTEEDFCAWAKQTLSPEKYAEIAARYKDWCEQAAPKLARTNVHVDGGRVFGMITLTHHCHPSVPE